MRKNKTLFTQTIAYFFLLISCCYSIAHAKIVNRILVYVNDDVVTQGELNKLIADRTMELQQLYRFSISEARERAQQERMELLDKLIRQMLLIQEAQRRQIQVDESEIDEHIRTLKEQFGITSDEEFKELLRRQGYTMPSFREKARKDLMGERLVQLIVLPKIDVVDDEINTFFEENRERFTTKHGEVHLRHILVKYALNDAARLAAQRRAEQVVKKARLGEDFAELARQHSDDERTKEIGGDWGQFTQSELETLPTAFQTALVQLGAGDVTESIEAEGGLHILKVEAKDADSMTLRYILIAMQPDENAKKAAFERMDTIRSRLENGEDFAQLASEYSDDADTKNRGGDLGIQNLDKYAPDIRTVIATLQEGQISEPIETLYGLHIFKLERHMPAQLTDEERKQIRVILRQQKFEMEWKKFTDNLKKKAFIKIKDVGN